MSDIDIARESTSHALRNETTSVPAPNAHFTPGDFFRDAGTVIAVCLALGLVMQILLG